MKTPFFILLTTFSISAFSQVEIDQKVVLTGTDGNRMIQQLEAPVDATDAVNKAYVDNAVSGSGGGFQPTMISNESATAMNFINAMRYCRDLEEGDFSDWRMPSHEQLVEAYVIGGNTVNNDTSSNYFWVGNNPGSASASSAYRAFRFSDSSLTVASGTTTYHVRCVR
jgi:hypothetical protein